LIDSTLHRDIAGRALAVDQHVVLCEHNRIIVGKIVRLYDPIRAGDSRVRIQPLNSTSGGRRPEPNAKPTIRLSYNLYLITDQELLVAILRGHV
jgi:hypothetical protein